MMAHSLNRYGDGVSELRQWCVLPPPQSDDVSRARGGSGIEDPAADEGRKVSLNLHVRDCSGNSGLDTHDHCR